MTKQIDRLITDVVGIKKDVSYIRKTLEGNGDEGLIKNVGRNSRFRIGTEAKGKLVRWAVGSGWVVTLAILVFMIVAGV